MKRQGLHEKLILLWRKGLLREKKKSTYRIYFADGLDKRVRIEPTLNLELEAEREELQELICNKATKFKIALTNPPFAMRYKREDPDQGPILKEYTLAKKRNRTCTMNKICTTNVNF